MNKADVAYITELENLLRSACCIAERQGQGTHWQRFIDSVHKVGLNGATPRMDDRQDYFDPLDEALDRIKARLDAMED